MTEPGGMSVRPTNMAGEFARLAQRSPTPVELDLLSMCEGILHRAGSLGPSSCASDSTSPVGALEEIPTGDRWVDGLLAESLVLCATAAGCRGTRCLFVTPHGRQMLTRQTRLGRRAPFSKLLDHKQAMAMDQGGTAWATPGELDPALVRRVFGPKGPDIVFVEELQAISPLASAYRPSLQRLAALLERYPTARLVGSAHLSQATVRRDVARRLGRPTLAADAHFIRETALLSNPDLRLEVLERDESAEPAFGFPAAVTAQIAALARPALVLCATIHEADRAHASLVAEQLPVHRYHAGLPETERAQELLQFALPGRRAILVAVSGFDTDAELLGDSKSHLPENFGPGYGKRDLRSLVRLSAPASLEQYARELKLLQPGPSPHPGGSSDPVLGAENEPGSRTDGSSDEVRSSVALMFFHPEQLMLHRSLQERRRITKEDVIAVVQTLAAGSAAGVGFAELARNGLQSEKRIERTVSLLVDAGLLTRRGSTVESLVPFSRLIEQVEQLSVDLETLREGDERRLEEVLHFATSLDCRQRTLDALLGRLVVAQPVCGQCDLCLHGQPKSDVQDGAIPTARESRVESAEAYVAHASLARLSSSRR